MLLPSLVNRVIAQKPSPTIRARTGITPSSIFARRVEIIPPPKFKRVYQ